MPVNVGIIPAGGKATRFGGIMKELLPLIDGRSLLEHATARLSWCDEIVVISNPEKMEIHKSVLQPDVRIVLQEGNELWGAIQTGYRACEGDKYFMTMPDTWFEEGMFCTDPYNVGLGCFWTSESKRFGIVRDGIIRDKAEVSNTEKAWGVIAFSDAVASYWDRCNFNNYQDAMNTAMTLHGCKTWNIGVYFDCATMLDYMKLLEYLKNRSV